MRIQENYDKIQKGKLSAYGDEYAMRPHEFLFDTSLKSRVQNQCTALPY